MLTIGDVFGIASGLTGLFLTAWAMTVASGLLFPNHANKAKEALEESPKKWLLVGFVLTLVPGLLGFGFATNPEPGARLIGWAFLLVLLALASIGLAGASKIVGSRIQEMDASLAAYPAFVRAAAYLIAAAMLPILGWFAFGPLLLIASMGAGWKAVFARHRSIELVEAA